MDRSTKRELRSLNLRIWQGETDIFPLQKSQDSSLKKNTAFIKRLRTAISLANVNTFKQEVASLSLHKYLSEIISACYEGLCKLKTPADISASVQIVSALHQRFGPSEFTGYLGWLVGRGLSTPDKSQLKALAPDVREREEKERLSRQRTLLRVATEFWLAGILRSLDDVIRPDFESKTKDGPKAAEPLAKAKSATVSKTNPGEHDPFPLEVLKDLLAYDREHVNLPLVVIFVKSFSWDILGLKPQALDQKREGESESDDSHDGPIASEELRQRFKNMLSRYFDDVKTHILKDQKNLVAQGKRNAEAYVRSGEVFEDRQANYEKQAKAQEKLVSNAQVLAAALGVEMPDMKDKDESQNTTDGSIGLIKVGDYLKGQSDGPGIWEDDDERRFYENLVDVKDRVPGILLDDGKRKKTDTDDQVGKKAEAKQVELTETKPEDFEDQNTAIANKSVGAQVDGLLARLPDLHGKDGVDQFSVDFCFVNSKASRNRLVKALTDVPKGRTDLLPLYARIVATLSKYMADVSAAVISYLDDEFRSLQRRKTKDFLGSVRLLNVRYLAELTKFGIVPEHVVFHCFKVCLDDLSRTNIEILGNLMENCGRYLLRNPETSPRMASFLETLQRKKGSQHLEQRERLVLENAIYFVNPPERPAIEQKERTPMELFIQKLVYDDLNKRNVDKITKQLRKLHWEEQEVVVILEKVFTRPWKVKYNNIHLLAVILGSLHRYHNAFAITCIDGLLENITLGLQFNDVKFNQRRMAQVKYLADLYVYRMVDSGLIFDTMYRILTFGYEGGTPRPDADNPWDASDDWFRIRLVCILLETCANFFSKGPVKKKLDFFVTFFQYYINIKDPLSPDIEFAIQDAFAVVDPELRLIDNLEEASKCFAEAVKQNYHGPAGDKSVEIDDMDDDSLSEDQDDDDEGQGDEIEKSSVEEVEVGDAAEESALESESAEEEEHIVVTRKEDERDPELDADFDRELAKLMAESMDSRKLERKTLFDVPLPLRRKEREPAADEQIENGAISTPGLMKFSLLSKRGNRQQTRDIDLPADSSFAVAMRNHQQAEKKEQQRIKDIVLNLDFRDENENADGEDAPSFAIEPNRNHLHRLGFNRTASIYHESALTGRYARQTSFGSKRHVSTPVLVPSRSLPLTPEIVHTSSALGTCSFANLQTQNLPSSIITHSAKGTLDKNPPNPYLQPRIDKAGKGRANQRGRQLQVSDLDWYDTSNAAENHPLPRRGISHVNHSHVQTTDNDSTASGRTHRRGHGRGRGH